MSAPGARAAPVARAVVRALAVATASALLPGRAPAQSAPQPSPQPPAAACATRLAPHARGSASWPAPLDRAVTSVGDSLSLHDALDQLAQATRVRLSYSPELLPLERRVCLPVRDRLALGDALRALLDGTGLVPVVAGGEQVVLAPGGDSGTADASPVLSRATGRLQRVVVTGSATGGPERRSPFALSVIDGDALVATGARSLSDVVDGQVPGLWLWSQSPTSALARWGSVRGASSFGVTVPKVYLDGIEVANPLLLTQLDAASVRRIEVIRGPQGAALYGADAISGVVNVVTRQGPSDEGQPHAAVRASAGASRSAFTPRSVLAQDYGLQLRAGTGARAINAGASMSTIGEYIPGAAARSVLASAGARHVSAAAVVTGTARFHASDADAPASPLFGSVPTLAGLGAAPRSRQYTVGGRAVLHGAEDWTHAFIAGLDGYRMSGVPADAIPVVSEADTSLRNARSAADRLTLRASSTWRAALAGDDAATVTLGLEHSSARETARGTGTRTQSMSDEGGVMVLDTASRRVETWWRSTGALVQAQLAFGERLVVNGGARMEGVNGTTEAPRLDGGPGTRTLHTTQSALLPMLGVAWVEDRGAWSLKLRSAYGRGIRPARAIRGATWQGGDLAILEPEEQSGVEAGADLLWDAPWRARLGLHATRFVQRASGLVQAVPYVDSTSYGWLPRQAPAPGPRGLHYELQNVGAIDNDGWELQATGGAGALALGATLTLVESRVRNVARWYRGDLFPGARMLEVPARTLGLTATWVRPRWSLGATIARAADWVNYDRVALADTVAALEAIDQPPPVGAQLRGFWREYRGVTRIGARLSATLWRGTALNLRAENLLDRQVGEPDNGTVLPGRTVLLGITTGF